ncbi:hypothetical protein EDB84DRAFT_1577947 [Lactarius hengduanensis]|nr:hypothetical protein EDB84DRAFT_1577947 [Lactarius hengduanensis]
MRLPAHTPETSGQPGQPRHMVRKVILRVSRPSGPDTPAALLPSPPPPEVDLPPQALPPPPPHLPHLVAGVRREHEYDLTRKKPGVVFLIVLDPVIAVGASVAIGQ